MSAGMNIRELWTLARRYARQLNEVNMIGIITLQRKELKK